MKHAVIILTCLGLVFPVHAEVRTWTSTDGREIEAEFVKGDEESVTIKLGTKQFTLPLDKITEADRERGLSGGTSERGQSLKLESSGA